MLLMEMLLAVQGWVQHSITADLSAFASRRDWLALAAVLPMGIVFGAAHALTPGHGKTVLATYLAGSRLALVRSLAVAAVLALTHIGSAVVLALAAAPLVTRTLGGVGRAPMLEDLSRGLLAVIGLWLLIRALRNRPHAHHEGVIVGIVAGLIPCPLTLFTMFFALSRGVPEAGLTFALAMMIGVGGTLGLVALTTIMARDRLVAILARHGTSLERLGRVLDAVAGLILLGIGVRELLR
jgi:nickel/cobalt transporter (NicO) family protein